MRRARLRALFGAIKKHGVLSASLAAVSLFGFVLAIVGFWQDRRDAAATTNQVAIVETKLLELSSLVEQRTIPRNYEQQIALLRKKFKMESSSTNESSKELSTLSRQLDSLISDVQRLPIAAQPRRNTFDRPQPAPESTEHDTTEPAAAGAEATAVQRNAPGQTNLPLHDLVGRPRQDDIHVHAPPNERPLEIQTETTSPRYYSAQDAAEGLRQTFINDFIQGALDSPYSTASGGCFDNDFPAHPCRYPSGDSWCAEQEGGKYAYRHGCASPDRSATHFFWDGFEAGLSNWSVNRDSNLTHIDMISAACPSGNGCLQIEARERRGYPFVERRFQAQEPGTLLVRGWFRVPSLSEGQREYHGAKIQAVVYEGGNQVAWPNADVQQPMMDWGPRSFAVHDLSAGQQVAIRIGLQEVSGIVQADDVSVLFFPTQQ